MTIITGMSMNMGMNTIISMNMSMPTIMNTSIIMTIPITTIITRPRGILGRSLTD